MLYPDRRAAGVELARAVARCHAPTDVVVGLARGGVVVAERVAVRLGTPLGVAVVALMRTPEPHGAPVGAALGDGTRWIDEDVVHARRMDERALDGESASAIVRSRWTQQQLGACGRRALAARSVLLVDDALVWPGRAIAAARWARRHGATWVTLAVPVTSRAMAERLGKEVDGLVALRVQEAISGLDEVYERLPAVDLAEVYALARKHAEEHRSSRPTILRRAMAALVRPRPVTS